MPTQGWNAECVQYLVEIRAVFVVRYPGKIISVFGTDEGWIVADGDEGGIKDILYIQGNTCWAAGRLAAQMGTIIMERATDEAEGVARIISIWGGDLAKAENIQVIK